MQRFKSYIKEQKFMKKLEPFLDFAQSYLDLVDMPEITLYDDKKMARENKSFGGYHPGTQEIKTNIAERHTADIFRTIAHELVHYRQHLDNRLDENSGDTGSDIENEANAVAGIILREYAKISNGDIFEGYDFGDAQVLNEGFFKKKTDDMAPKGFGWSESEKYRAEYLAKRHNDKLIKLRNGEYGIIHPSSPGTKGKKHFDNSDDFKYDLK